MANIAVIGANFGDEGKGLLTDYYARKHKNSIVVRTNGGSQAGHTVNDGANRHVFHHFGSGTLADTPTFLSSDFVCNPLLFTKEYELLTKPKVFVSNSCIVSTPYDMILNQLAEKVRGDKKHGSCGVGFGETVARNLIPEFAFTIDDCFNISAKLDDIRKKYVPMRAAELNIDINHPTMQLVLSNNILFKYMIDLHNFLQKVEKITPSNLAKYNNVIFEAAQGLLLDQNSSFFPYVTRSNTGLKNILKIAKEANLTDLEVTYVTRAYLTRHGAGPLPFEVSELPFKVVDQTNIHNEFQDSLRFAPLNLDLLIHAIREDLRLDVDNIVKTTSIAITCLDQITEVIPVVFEDMLLHLTIKNVISILQDNLNVGILTSQGPTANDISC
jgi:adenylosuccinate synthase